MDQPASSQTRSPIAAICLAAAVAGGLLAVVGSFMTWAEIDVPLLDTITLDGFDDGREGQLTLGLGIAAAVVAASAWLPRLRLAGAAGTTVLGVAILAVAFADMRELDDDRKILDQIGILTLRLSDIVGTELGTGLYLVTAGGAIATIGGAAALATAAIERRRGAPA